MGEFNKLHGFHIRCRRSYRLRRGHASKRGSRMFRSIAITTAAAMTCALVATESAQAQATDSRQTQKTEPAQAQPTASAPAEKPIWHAPFGGTFTAGAAFTTDYSYRGLSQTQRQVAFQPTITYETPTVSESLLLSAYGGAWASNVYFPGTGAAAEIDLYGGFRYKAMGGKFTADLGYIRYNYTGAIEQLQLGFNEFGLVVGYDFGPVALSAAVRYSPNF